MALTAGALSQVSVTDVGDVLASAAAVSGTTPYSYQWYRSTVSAFATGTGNILSGQTALTIQDLGLTPSTVYFYKVVVTDSAGTAAIATSSQLQVTTLSLPGNNLSLSNFVNVSVASAQSGIGTPNTANLALFTREAYGASFGTLGYKIYLSPSQVGLDFGTSSNTYNMALSVFTPQPNIQASSGYLVVIPFLSSAQNQQVSITFPGTPTVGSWAITYNSNATSALAYNASAATVQTSLQLVAGLNAATVTGSIAAGFTINAGVSGIGYPFTITSNTLVDANGNAVTPVVTVTVPGSTGETLDQAIIRTQPIIAYFGVMAAEVASQVVTLAAARYIQTQNLIGFFVSYTSSDLSNGGMLYAIQAAGLTQSRCLFYDDVLSTSLGFMASYATLLLSVNYGGSQTCLTMSGKSLSGVTADPNITQTIYNQASLCGADVYAYFGGVPKCTSFVANDTSDNQTNLQAFALALKTAYFNVLAQTNTKIPQTEDGMNIIKAAIRSVCQQFVTNGFIAPGTWTNPTTFGNQTSLIQNVAQFGYYIYSTPVSQQSATARTARQAPLIQLAIKYAGAVQSGSLVVYVNA